jgi:HK97 family phage prohead protease
MTDQTLTAGEEDVRDDTTEPTKEVNVVRTTIHKKARHRAVPLTPEFRHRAAPLTPEVRGRTVDIVEVRKLEHTNELVLAGTPIVFNAPYGVRDMFGEFQETMVAGVAKGVLEAGADVRLLLNHDPNMILARSINERGETPTMTLREDASGLHFEARIDLRSQLANDVAIAIERGDVSQMSCGFIVARDEWDDLEENRTIYQFASLLDVSPVTYPASPTTSVQIAQRMALEMPLESRARLRRLVLEGRAGQLSRDGLAALESMLDASPDESEEDATAGEDEQMIAGRTRPLDTRKAAAWDAEHREGMSYGNMRDMLRNALGDKFATGEDEWVYLEDFGDDWVVYELKNEMLRCSYSIDGDKVTLGKPETVTSQTTYVPMETKAAEWDAEHRSGPSHAAMQSAITAAIRDLPDAGSLSAYLRDFDDDTATYESGGKVFQVPYTVQEDGSVKLGDPQEVQPVTHFQPVESKSAKEGEPIRSAKAVTLRLQLESRSRKRKGLKKAA